jgi:uracil-DNA glycosylase
VRIVSAGDLPDRTSREIWSASRSHGIGIPLRLAGRHVALDVMEALGLLRLQIEWGADEALEDAPVDRFRQLTPRQPAQPDQHTRAAPQSPGSRPSSAERAVAAAGQAATLAELRSAIAMFDGCVLRDTAANLVFADGDPASGLLLIGDPPGESEDRSGTPFAGPDGGLLDRMLASVTLTRRDLMVAPLIPWRPPGGRPPNPAEIAVCLPFLYRLIVLSRPHHVILAGSLPARVLLPSAARRRTTPGWIPVSVPGLAEPVPALAMPSPASVARTPAARREAWAALRLIRRTLATAIAEK